MIRRLTLATIAFLITVPLAAQAPDGWQMRLDASTNAAEHDDVPEVTVNRWRSQVARGFEVFTGPAVTMWNPANTASGNYTLEGTFTLLEPSGHVNYYGLIYGAGALEAERQNYIYFLVGQNGTYVIRHRAGDETVHDIMGRTENAAIMTPDANGQSVNHLEVRVGADETQFLANGTVLHTAARTGMAARSDGIWGVRINHVIPGVRVEGLRLTR